jgi:hypothetical protein
MIKKMLCKSSIPVIVLFLLCAVLVVGCGDGSSSTILEPGATVEIGGSSNSTVCSTSKENHQQLAKYARAKDKQGMQEMLLQGKIFLVEKGTTAKVLQTTTLDGIEIKIQDGNHKGTECWTERSFLTRTE